MYSDKKTNLHELKTKIKSFVEERDWEKYHKPKEIAISISIESAELLELFQWTKEDELNLIFQDANKLENIKDEISDIVIYCLDLANALNIDVSQAIENKVKKNEEKYPVEKIKGKYKKYTEL
ncbi:nucleotide pyrophosphohydrolase [Chloroflexota bacterium]